MPTESIGLAMARPGDASTLARVSERAFDNDIHYGAPGPGGPPGYDSDSWQRRMMKDGHGGILFEKVNRHAGQ